MVTEITARAQKVPENLNLETNKSSNSADDDNKISDEEEDCTEDPPPIRMNTGGKKPLLAA